MLAMCREAPIHSELRFLGDLHARSGAQEDGEVVARRSLAQRHGSTAELDRLLDSEATRWEALWAVRAGTQSERS
jgi:hypothetical protein